jgi:HlyD family secretion protein
MNVWLKRSLILLVVVILVFGWVLHFHNEKVAAHLPKWAWLQTSVKKLGIQEAAAKEEGDEDPDNTKNEVPVHTVTVSVATMHQYIDGIGAIGPRPARAGQMAGSANLASPVAGVVAKVLCQAGQQVHANDPVIQLDDRLAKSAEEQAAAGLAQAQASLAALKATPRPDQLQIAELNVGKAKAALEFAQKGYERQKLLAANEGVSGKSVDQAKMELGAAENDLAVSQKQLALLKSSPTPEELHAEQAKVAQAQAALATAKTQRQMMTIKSPIDATVMAVSINPGESVDTTRTLVQLISMDRLQVAVDVPANQLPQKVEGLPAEILLTSAPATEGAEPLMGKVAFVSPQVDVRNGSVMVGVDLPAGSTLRPGLSVRVRIIVAEHKDCLVVPGEAVVTDENGDNVVAVIEGEQRDESGAFAQATHKAVKAGIEENGMIEISADGISEGTKVVTAGAFGLPAASRVKLLD